MKFSDSEFKSTITIGEKARLVNKIADSIFDEDMYLPEIFEEQFWIHVADAYIVDHVKDDFTPDEFMDELYNGGLKDKIEQSVNSDQLMAVKLAVNERIDLRLNRKPSDEFFERATVLLSKIERAVEGINLADVVTTLGNLDISADIAKALAPRALEAAKDSNSEE